MGAWVVPPVAGLIEPAVAPEFYIDGIGAIERIGNNVRLYCFARQLTIDGAGGEEQKTVTLKIVRPIDSVARSIANMIKIMTPEDDRPLTMPDVPKGPRLVK